MSRQRKNKKRSRQSQSRQSSGIAELQMLEPRILMSTTVLFRAGGGTGYTDASFDDSRLAQGSDTNDNSYQAYSSAQSGSIDYGVLAIKDLFTADLPSGISISSAKLHIFRYNTGTSSDTIYVDRMISNWLPNAPGSSETNVTYKHESLSPSQTWAGGDISASDYTTTNQGSAAFVSGANQECIIDITGLMQDIYSTGTNYGMIIRSSNTTSFDNYFTSDYGTQAYRPVLEITYDTTSTVTIAATTPDAYEPGTAGAYTVTRTGSTTNALPVSYTVSGTATNGTDYTTLSGTVTIPSGQASTTIALTPINDNIVEFTESAIVTLVAGTGYTVGTPNAATVRITDNDSTVSIVATQPNAAEPSTNGTFTVTRAGYTGASVTVNYTIGGTATNGTDYTTLPGTVTIPGGQTTATINVAVIDDATTESTESVILTLTSGTDYTVGTPNPATVNIADNDATFSVTGVTGMVNANQPLTITGNLFGSGPDNVVFDNYDGGTVGTAIKIGPGSATVGNWDRQEGVATYSTDSSVSGKQAEKSDWTTPKWENNNVRYFPAGTSQIYFSFCFQIPTTMPGLGNSGGINWKYIWVMGTNQSYAYDDTYVAFVGPTGGGPSNQMIIAGNCMDPYAPATTTYPGWSEGNQYNAGDWIRETVSMVGSTTNGSRAISLLNLTTGASLTNTYTGRTWAGGSPDEWRAIGFNDFGRENTPNCTTLFDDAYSSTGANDLARVEIGNASTYAACTKLSTCPTTAWSGTSITANVNLGSLDPAGPLYLYVTKADGSLFGTTSAGYAITASQAPAAVTDKYSVTTNGTLTTTAQTGVIANDVDLQGGTITASKVANPSHGSVTVNSNGSFTYTPTANYYGPDSFTYQDSDGTHTGNTGTVNIDVRQTIVDFGSSLATTTFGPTWTTVVKDSYMYYNSVNGQYGLDGDDWAIHAYGGASGTGRTFNTGETVYVTWYNESTTATVFEFKPVISFTDPDGYGDGTTGTWYNMTTVTIYPGQSVTTSYTIDAGSAGSHTLVNVCRNNLVTNLMLDKIEID